MTSTSLFHPICKLVTDDRTCIDRSYATSDQLAWQSSGMEMSRGDGRRAERRKEDVRCGERREHERGERWGDNEWPRERRGTIRWGGTCLFDFPDVRMKYFRWGERERETESEATMHLCDIYWRPGPYGCIVISQGLTFHMASTETIIVYEGRAYIYRNVLAAHASDENALSFLPHLAGRRGFVKSAPFLSRSDSRCSSLWYSTASYINFCTKHWLMPVPRDRADRRRRAPRWRGRTSKGENQDWEATRDRVTARYLWDIVREIIEARCAAISRRLESFNKSWKYGEGSEYRENVSARSQEGYKRQLVANWFSSHLAINVN